ncbi:MAG TPA: immunoglobulin domain-containing protein, partial [Verrucomicrobiae bacterium]|nr:immunoglobulin domain-containing protein [Verrucomicrobiae bacterium]
SNPAGGDNTVLIDNVGFLAGGTPVSITSQPASQIVGLGGNATFTVGTFGSAPISYQWFFGSEAIPGATGQTLVLPVTSGDQAGEYSVVVSNAGGSETSATASLTVRASVAGLFNTGVDENGAALADGAVDPHYTLSVNANGSSTEAIVHDSTIFPIVTGPWLANAPDSKWIAPLFNTEFSAGLATNEGRYVYSTTFDLTGIDIPSVVISGGWAMDNNGVAIRVNGASIGQSTAGFATLTPFTITSANANLVDGINTLDFEVVNADVTAGYTALRVANLQGLAILPGTPVSIAVQPQGGTFGTGEQVVLSVVAEGSSPISYQWSKDGTDIAGATGSSLTLSGISAADGGAYAVHVSNPFGDATSDDAVLTVRTSVPGLYNTGVDDNGVALADGSVDPHYQIIVNPDGPSPDAIVEDSTVFPILAPAGPWIANTAGSKWIGPRLETSGAAGAVGDAGNYIYRLQFDMTGLDPSTVEISG